VLAKALEDHPSQLYVTVGVTDMCKRCDEVVIPKVHWTILAEPRHLALF